MVTRIDRLIANEVNYLDIYDNLRRNLVKFRYFGLSAMLITGLAATTGMTGCAPGEEETGETEVAIDGSAGLPPAFQDGSDTEGSDPKNPATEDEAVDTSIRDAAEFGDDALLEGLIPEGWSQTGDIEHFNVATLYNKIDGRSELYMAYDVKGLSWVSMVQDDNQDNFLDVFVYDMSTTTGAFGIYSVEREPDQEKIKIGRECYRTGSNLYFWKGQHYAYINASREHEDNDAAALFAAKKVLDRVGDDGGEIVGLDWLPSKGLNTDSIQYFMADAMSLDFMNKTFVGKYDFGNGEIKSFISKRDSAEDATAIFSQFNEYGGEYGDSVEKVSVNDVEVGLTDWGGGFYDGVAVIGNSVVGVSNVEGKEAATSSMENLIGQLK